MASKTFSKKCSVVGGFKWAREFTLYVELEEVDINISKNTSKVKYNVYAEKPKKTGSYFHARHLKYFKIYGDTITNTTQKLNVSGYPATIRIASGTTDEIKHNNDGNKTISFSAKIKGVNYGISASIEEDFELDKIPRGFTSTPNLSRNSRTETTYTFNWSTSELCSNVKLYMNGSLKKELSGLATISGTISVTGLEAGTSYNTYIRCTRRDTGVTTDSRTSSYDTIDYPYFTVIERTNGLTIGDWQTVNIYNPLGRTVTIEMRQNNASGTLLYSGTTSTTYLTFKPDADLLYSTIPNAQKSACVYRVIYSNISTRISSTQYYKVRGDEVPIFDADIEVLCVGTVDLTGENALILGQSDVEAYITTEKKATGQKGSSIYKYRLSSGNDFVDVLENENNDITLHLNDALDPQIIVYAIDSRGLTSSKIIKFDTYDYEPLKILSLSANRTNNILSETKLTFKIWFYNTGFLIGRNSIQSIIYEYKKTTDNTWTIGTTEIDVSDIPLGQFEIEKTVIIKGDLGDEGFDVENSYDINFYVFDKLSGDEINTVLKSGTPAMAIYKNKVAFGKKYDTTIGKQMQVFGDSYFDGNLYRGVSNKVLWSSTGMYMFATQTATLSEKVSDQLTGIVLVWAYWENNTTQNYWYNYTFVPKHHISKYSGAGISFFLVGGNFDRISSKYLHIYDNRITGDDYNTLNGTKNGVTYDNKYYVLVEVLGV